MPRQVLLGFPAPPPAFPSSPQPAASSNANSSLLTIVRAQIVFLLSTLSEDNWIKNRDEIRMLIEQHGPEPQAHFIRRLILAAATLLAPSVPGSPPPPANPSQPTPQPALVMRLLTSEVTRMARDPSLAERFRDAVIQGAEGPAGADNVLRSFSLPTLLAHSTLNDLSPLERLVFVTPFLTLLYASPSGSTPAPTGLKRALGLDAATVLRTVLAPALDQLSLPAASAADLAELSPLPLSKILAILLSDMTVGDRAGEGDAVLNEGDRKSIILAAVRGRLGTEVGAQALAHGLNDMSFSPAPTPVAVLTRLCPAVQLCSIDLVRAVFAKFAALGPNAATTAGAGAGGEENGASGGAELKVAAMLTELVDLATRDAESGAAIDLANFVRAIHELEPALRWGDVVRSYDTPSKALPDSWGLRLFAAFLPLSPSPPPSTPSAIPPPPGTGLISAPGGTSAVSGLFSPWANPPLQFTLLERLIYLPPEAFSLAAVPSIVKCVSLDDAANSSPTIKGLAASVQGLLWNVRDLVGALIRLSSAGGGELQARVLDLLERACKSHPDLVLIALIQVEKPWNQLTTELTARLLSTFLSGHPSHQLVFLRIYQIDRVFLTAALRDFYAESEINVSRILDVAQDLKILDLVLDLRPFFLALDLAALASRREYLNLDKWLTGSIATHGGAFVRATLEFVGHKVQHDLRRQELDPPEPTTLSLSAATVAIFMRALRSHHELFTGNDVELFKEVRTQCLQLYPRLMNFAPGNTDNEPGMAVVTFAPEIETECDGLYKRMYEQEISVDSVVSALQRAKESENAHDHEFLACFLHGLFDEHRWFNTYPANELTLTAHLFGDLIQFQLIDFIPLGIAVRYVLDALRHPPESNWFSFGIQALRRFQGRLAEWPQLSHSILSIPHVQQHHPDVANIARTALQQREGGENGLDFPADVVNDVPLDHPDEIAVFTAIHVDRSEGEPAAPSEDISDKILFIVNNLAPNNFDVKVGEMSERIEPAYFAWFAHYLVAQRVAIEPNNHQLYHKFLDALSMPLLAKRVLHETFVKLATLLNSEKTVQSSTERTLLKNLGSWLGGLTLAKNKPIKQSNIAMKELLIQGYDSNRLIVAIPFVCKVLEQCAKSKVFMPPNPWLMAILRLLVELYQFAELKLNLKFEIEVLCKSLNVDLKDVEPTDLLRSRPKELPPAELSLTAPPEGTADEQQAALSRSFAPPGVHALSSEAGRGPASGLVLGSQAGYSLSLQDTISAALQTLPNHITFNPQIPLFANNAALKRLVFVAIDRAVREIIAPVVERSVTIAGISTRELTMKDFAMEGDEEKMGTAAHLMVQNLAGSLALVTCKEPLRISMVTHIRNLLLQNGFSEQNIPEQAILVVAADNLELACGVVEKVAMEKAVLEVDDGLAPAYLARRTHRERSREAFWDTAAMAASHYSGMLPDPLRLKLGGLQPQQLQVYEDFSQEQRNGIAAAYGGESPAIAAAQAPQLADAAPVPTVLSGPQAMEKFSGLISDLEKCLATESVSSLARLAPESEIRQIVQQIPLIAAGSISRDETALGCSQKIVQLLYRSETALAREVYVYLLERLCSIFVKVAKEVTAWLVYAEDERKFNVPVTTALIQARLISAPELDVQLAKFITREYRPSVVDFAARLVAECLMETPPVATKDQLIHSLEALTQAARSGKATETSRQLLTELRGVVQARPESPSKIAGAADSAAVREQLTYCFAEWVRLYQQSFSVEKSFVDFVVQLQNQGILKGEEISSLFFRVCAEVSVESYIKHKAAGATPATGIFQPVDAFAKLIVFMIKYHADPTGANNDKAKVHYMTKVLSIVVLVLANSHEELGPNFQQKPFFRFFSSLLSNLHAIEGHLGSAYYQILVALSHSVNTLQPLFFPGFTFSWVGLISHRLFMPKLLMMKDKEGWSSFHRQLISLLRFLAPFLRRGELADTTRALYLGTERILLVLVHDFPDFLSQAAFSLCDAIPAQCTQLLNLVLSAFPVPCVLPDPLQKGLKLESLADIAKSPAILTDFTSALSTADLRAPLDKYLQTREPANFPATLKEHLQLAARPEDPKANIPLINSLVLYLGVVAINQSKAQTGGVTFSSKSASYVLLQQLLSEMEPEGRYFLIGAAANQLRYPNAHTYYNALFLITVFAESTDDLVREQILRVLLERIMVQKPHPWALLYVTNRILTGDSLQQHLEKCSVPQVASLLTEMQTRAIGAVVG
ncbi:CCR4-NOT transcription complex subunit 1 [Pseudohyphozyma bogoriensis]|nr:CCR4-NOT transcription complex subunit 1 [Pseudohyphozyma bogoriensis]